MRKVCIYSEIIGCQAPTVNAGSKNLADDLVAQRRGGGRIFQVLNYFPLSTVHSYLLFSSRLLFLSGSNLTCYAFTVCMCVFGWPVRVMQHLERSNKAVAEEVEEEEEEKKKENNVEPRKRSCW